ncbi:hypothetical protein ACLKA7_006295 [Drosophila subpalustris]
MNNTNNFRENPYLYAQQQPQPPVAVPVPVHVPVPVVVAPNLNLNLLHAHAQPNFNAISPYNMNYLQPCNQMMRPLYAYNSPPPIQLYTQPIYNPPPLNNPLYNPQHGQPIPPMPPNNSYCGPPQLPNFMPQSSAPALNVDHDANKENQNPGTQSQSTNSVKNHVYLNGMLYNTDYLAPEADEAIENNTKDAPLDEEEETYDPSSDPPPSIYGLRFYNPFYGPEGAIPKPNVAKVKPCPKVRKPPGPPEALANGLPQFKGFYSQLALHRLAHADCYGAQAQAVARDILHKNQLLKNQQVQEQEKQHQELDKKVDTVRHNSNSNNNNSSSYRVKSKQRRQGRNRFRGFTQSFGIVAPVKRDCAIPNENVEAAKNVLSLFDSKHSYKKWPLDELDMDMDNNDEWTQSITDNNNNDTFYKDS